MRRIVFPVVVFSTLLFESLFLDFSAVAATLPVITEFPTPDNGLPEGITVDAADGTLWFTGHGEIGRITTSGAITDFAFGGGPNGIALGSDGALWFTATSGNIIGRITTTGNITGFTVPTPNSYPDGITAGPDGALWFVEFAGNKVGRITTSGVITEFPTGNTEPEGITSGPDGALWFTEIRGNKIGRITTSGTITEFILPTANSQPNRITTGADGALWFTQFGQDQIGRITTEGVVTEIPIPRSSNGFGGSQGNIIVGPDGAIWFPDTDGNAIGRIVTTSAPFVVTQYDVPTNLSSPIGIAPGPDGALWFTEPDANQIGRITVPTDRLTASLSGDGQGQVTSSSLGQASLPGIACGNGGTGCTFDFPAGNLVTLTASAHMGSVFRGWAGSGCAGTGTCAITLSGDSALVARFSLASSIAMLSVTTSGNGQGSVASNPSGIACGATCNTLIDLNTNVTLTATPSSSSTFTGWTGGGCVGVAPCTVTLAQAKTVNANFISNSSSDITLVSALLPTSRSVQIGSTATFFGTMINASTDTAGANCTVAPTTSIPATFFFQTTDPATNALNGAANTPVTIAPGAAQSFLLALTPTSAFAPTDVAFAFTCSNSAPASSSKGLNTLLLSGSAAAVPDIIALAATASNDGIVDIPGVSGTGAFAVATANVGATGAITASANDGVANLPVAITICQTNPVSGQCLSAPATSAPTTINAGSTPTYAIFVNGSGTVPFQPAANRIFVQFMDAGGAVRGSTSVAVRTQ